MELPGCAGHSSSAQSSIRGGGDANGAQPWRDSAVRSLCSLYQVKPCFIFDREMLIGRISGTQGVDGK